jgi:hypothetical protein
MMAFKGVRALGLIAAGSDFFAGWPPLARAIVE